MRLNVRTVGVWRRANPRKCTDRVEQRRHVSGKQAVAHVVYGVRPFLKTVVKREDLAQPGNPRDRGLRHQERRDRAVIAAKPARNRQRGTAAGTLSRRQKDLLLYADVAEQAFSKLLEKRGIHTLRLGCGTLEQRLEAPVIGREKLSDRAQRHPRPLSQMSDGARLQ